MPKRRVKQIKRPAPGNVLRIVKLCAAGNRLKEGYVLPSDDRVALYTRKMGGYPDFKTGVFTIDAAGGGLVVPDIRTTLQTRRLGRRSFAATMAISSTGTAPNQNANDALWTHQVILGYPDTWILSQPNIEGDVFVEVPETWHKVTIRGRTRAQIRAALGPMTGKDGMLFEWGDHEFHTIYVRDPAKVTMIGLMV